MQYCHPKSLPSDPNATKIDFETNSLFSDRGSYQEMVGSLSYLMCCTRADISYVVNKLPQYMDKPTLNVFQ